MSPMSPADYEAWYDTPRGRWIGEVELRLLRSALDFPPGAAVLDVGCGTGWFTRRIGRATRVGAIGVDINREYLEYARGRDPRSNYVQADALALPFADNSFDAAVSIVALCFVDNWRRAVAELVRVSRDGFAVAMLNRSSILWRQKGRDQGKGAYHGATWVTAGELRQCVANLPVRDVRVRSAVVLPSGTPVARTVENLIPSSIPLGAFLLVLGRKGIA